MDINERVQVFLDWTKRKIFHHFSEAENEREFYFREKEIWWAALGKNIGFEADGKHELFERPVLIIKKYGKDMCFVLPLTTQLKDPLPWYQIPIDVDDTKSAVNLTQGKTICSKRLLRKMVILESDVFNNVLRLFLQQFG